MPKAVKLLRFMLEEDAVDEPVTSAGVLARLGMVPAAFHAAMRAMEWDGLVVRENGQLLGTLDNHVDGGYFLTDKGAAWAAVRVQEYDKRPFWRRWR